MPIVMHPEYALLVTTKTEQQPKAQTALPSLEGFSLNAHAIPCEAKFAPERAADIKSSLFTY